MAGRTYSFGHDARELRRLQLQGKILGPGTERMLVAAGLQTGHCVLDVGTGAGDVALIAAALTGPTGDVLGIDTEPSILDLARHRAEEARHAHIRFEAHSLETLSRRERFDIVIARYVLLHQVDPVTFLSRISSFVRPGGSMVLIEPCAIELGSLDHALGEVWSNPPAPLYDDTLRHIMVALSLAGVRVSVGGSFISLFKGAGLPEPVLRQEIPMAGPAPEYVEWAVLSLCSLLPILERHGVTTGDRIGIETLQDRMQTSVSVGPSQLRFANIVGAWAKIG